MSHLTAALLLYRNAAREATREFRRSLWALPLLALTQVAWWISVMALHGTMGGLVLGLVESFLVGWYLSLVDISVLRPRRLDFGDVQSRLGGLFNETMSVLFAFWLPQLLLRFTMPDLLALLVPIAALAFNPVPELIYQGRNTGFALLGDALRFMTENWPEWLLAHLPLWLLAAAALGLGQSLEWGLATEVVTLFGPFFGFALSGPFAISLQLGAPVLGIVSLVLVHWCMLFRGRLFAALNGSNRRGRAWATRVGP